MICWLAFGEHEALKGDMQRARILIPAEGKHTIPPRIYPADRRGITLRRPPPLGGPKMLCWLASGKHEALKRNMSCICVSRILCILYLCILYLVYPVSVCLMYLDEREEREGGVMRWEVGGGRRRRWSNNKNPILRIWGTRTPYLGYGEQEPHT